MLIKLLCLNRGYKGQTWLLDLTPERATIRDASGRLVGSCEKADAARRFWLPGQHPHVKEFTILFDGGPMRFTLNKTGRDAVHRFVGGAIMKHAPAVEDDDDKRSPGPYVLFTGLLTLLAGMGLIALEGVDDLGRHSLKVAALLVIVGFVVLQKGLYDLRQHRRLTRDTPRDGW